MRIELKDKKQFISMFNELFEKNKINNINGVTIDSRKVEINDIFNFLEQHMLDYNKGCVLDKWLDVQ